MPTERIDIVINERGSRRVRRNIREIGSDARRAHGGVSLLQTALLGIGGTLVVRQLAQLADAYTNIQNRLRVVTTGTGELVAVTESLFGISNRTRVEFEATAQIYQRLAAASQDLGSSQQELLNFTESLNQAVTISGATAEEAQGALVQLSQGIASTELRGQELRSVLEQLPFVAQVIADHFDVARGSLIKLGEQGKISAGAILEAFRNAREEIGERFARIIPTISQSFVVFRNNLVGYIGRVNESLGITRVLSQLIIGLSGNLDTVGMAAQSLAFILGVVLARRAIPTLISAVRALTVAVVSNPLGALATAAVAITSVLVGFRNSIRVTSESAATLGDVFAATGNLILSVLRPAIDELLSLFRSLSEFLGETLTFDFKGILTFFALIGDRAIGLYDAVSQVFVRLPLLVGEVIENELNRVIRGFNYLFESIKAGINDFSSSLGFGDVIVGGGIQESDFFQGAFERTVENARQAFDRPTIFRDTTDLILQGAEQRAQERLARQRAEQDRQGQVDLTQGSAGRQVPRPGDIALQAYSAGLVRENQLLRLNSEERTIQEALFKAEDIAKRTLTATETRFIESIVRQNVALQTESDLFEEITGPARDYETQISALVSLLQRGRITSDEFTTAQRNLRNEFLQTQTDLGSGVERFFLQLQIDAMDTASLVQSALTNAFRAAGDAFADFVTGAGISFRGLVRSILADLARLAAQQAFLRLFGPLLSAGVSGAGASVASSPSSVIAATSNLPNALGGQTGGLVSGPGSGTSDSIPIRLSNGEFVVNAAATQNNLALLNRINQGQGSGGGTTIVQGGPVNVVFESAPEDGQLTPEQAAQIGAEVRAIAQQEAAQVFTEEQRPGGRLFGSRRAA